MVVVGKEVKKKKKKWQKTFKLRVLLFLVSYYFDEKLCFTLFQLISVLYVISS